MKSRTLIRKKKQARIYSRRKAWGRLFLFLISFLIIYLIFFVAHNFKNALWDGEHNFNFVIQQDRTYIYAYQPFSQVVNIISLPNETVIPAAKGYGDYQLGKIAALGEMEGIGAGSLLSLSLSQVFKAPLEGEMICQASHGDQAGDLSAARLWGLGLDWLQGKCNSSLSWWDFFRLSRSLSQLKLNQVRLIPIEETSLWQKQTLADQTQVYTLASSLINDFSQRYFTDETIVSEDLKIVVLNATEFNGLARFQAEFLKNIGAQVINSQDEVQKTDRSIIYFRRPEIEKSYTLVTIKKIFKIEKAVLDEGIEADLLLILGEDFLNKFYFR